MGGSHWFCNGGVSMIGSNIGVADWTKTVLRVNCLVYIYIVWQKKKKTGAGGLRTKRRIKSKKKKKHIQEKEKKIIIIIS